MENLKHAAGEVCSAPGRCVGARRRSARLVACLAVVGSGGCTPNLAGTWHTVRVDPPGAPFPLEQVTFDEAGRYAASWGRDGERHTSVGAYRQSMNRLEIIQDGRLSRRYALRRNMDGSMVLTYREGGATMSAILERRP